MNKGTSESTKPTYADARAALMNRPIQRSDSTAEVTADVVLREIFALAADAGEAWRVAELVQRNVYEFVAGIEPGADPGIGESTTQQRDEMSQAVRDHFEGYFEAIAAEAATPEHRAEAEYLAQAFRTITQPSE